MLTESYGTDRLQAVIHERSSESIMRFGDIEISAIFGAPGMHVKQGACLALDAGNHNFFLLGYGCIPGIASLDKDHPYAEYLTIEEGEFVNSIWTPSRILNGDEEHIRINEPTLLKFGVHTFS